MENRKRSEAERFVKSPVRYRFDLALLFGWVVIGLFCAAFWCLVILLIWTVA